MKIYLLQNNQHSLDHSLEEALKRIGMNAEHLELPNDHTDIGVLFKDKENGVIFLPGIWPDLYSVKIIQEIERLSGIFETVMVDKVPEASQLVVAFNEGLSAYLDVPFLEDRLTRILARMKIRYNEKIQRQRMQRILEGLESSKVDAGSSQGMLARNHSLGKAFLDVIKGAGPLFNNAIDILLISSSQAQQNRMEVLLKALKMRITKCQTLAESLKKMNEQDCKAIIMDNILPDGDAESLVKQLRKQTTRMPKIIVWSSSPEKVEELLKPENYIDEVILKPTPEVGMEFILPSVIHAIYQMEDL